MKKEKASFEKVLAKIEESFGLKNLSESETALIKQAYEIFMGNGAADMRPEEIKKMYGDKNPVIQVCSQVADERAGIKWSTGGHSGAKVQTTAIGVGSEMFKGELDNTEIPLIIRKIMGL